jgi:hypothetical protein
VEPDHLYNYGPQIIDCNREVAALKRCVTVMYRALPLGACTQALSSCNKEVATLHSDDYTTQVRLLLG